MPTDGCANCSSAPAWPAKSVQRVSSPRCTKPAKRSCERARLAKDYREIHEIRENQGYDFFAYLACFAVYEIEAILLTILHGRSESMRVGPFSVFGFRPSFGLRGFGLRISASRAADAIQFPYYHSLLAST